MRIVLVVFLLLAGSGPFSESNAQTQITVTAANRLNIARESETIELTAEALAPLAEKDLGMQGLAILTESHAIDQYVDETSNHLLVLKRGISTPVTYWAGFAWDRAGRITSAGAWSKYVDQFHERLNSPIAVTVK